MNSSSDRRLTRKSMFRLVRLSAFVLLGIAAASISRAQSSCPQEIKTVSTCPSGCRVNTLGVLNQEKVGQPCYANDGVQVDCPYECSGEYVYTASVNGNFCMGSDGCESGDIRRSARLLRDGLFAKVYAPDCNGDMRVLLTNSPYVRKVSAKVPSATKPMPIPASKVASSAGRGKA
jgi:hypothetical protein